MEEEQKPQMKCYPVNDEMVKDLNHRFTYHAPKPDQPDRYQLLRAMGRDVAITIIERVPPGREQSLALTKLEEAIFWANAGIARNE